MNRFYFKTGGPIFLFTTGEVEARAFDVVGGPWVELAKKVGGLVLQLEHRYYGESKPTK